MVDHIDHPARESECFGIECQLCILKKYPRLTHVEIFRQCKWCNSYNVPESVVDWECACCGVRNWADGKKGMTGNSKTVVVHYVRY